MSHTKTHVRHYDTIVGLNPGLVHHPIRHISVVKQEDSYNCCVCVLTVVIVYLYYPSPRDFPWHTLNYPTIVTRMRNVIIAILQTDTHPILNANPIVTPADTVPHPNSCTHHINHTHHHSNLATHYLTHQPQQNAPTRRTK